ncbi:MAG TPA: SMP-30/gluconolactonase/LRE family protein, partial [Candidatus Acidoferrales bacterium]|nr:SMP-30/gluconolactonase/LRE family protein [Candidatus Acidoferrales bacterium]
MNKLRVLLPLALLTLAPGVAPLRAQLAPATTPDAPAPRPAAVINLATPEGVALVKGHWRYSDVRIIEVEHRSPGADLRPSGPPNPTLDITPKAGAADFDDSNWQAIEPAGIETRRAGGRFCFNWYRIRVTLPEKVAAFEVTGSTVVFELVVDDYSEIWVNGMLPVVLGQTGGGLVKGFNAPNRVVLTRDARPGQQFELAIFGANGPMSSPPGNYIWIRSATLDFLPRGAAGNVQRVEVKVDRRDAGLDEILPVLPTLERVATGFYFTEGPVWVKATPTAEGYLLFSDPNANTIYRWSQDGQISVYMAKSGYTGFNIGEYGQPGSNGLTLSKDGLLTIDQHGNRRVVRQERTGAITVLADRYQGKRLNSPNDLVYKSDGSLYFTDPPFGLPKFFDDPRKELPFSGVYRLSPDGKQLQLVSKDLSGPNGLAFSPDEKYFYLTNWDEKKKVVMRYEVNADGTLSNGQVFFDMTNAPGEDALDGMKVDQKGNLYVSGPGGLWILSPEG